MWAMSWLGLAWLGLAYLLISDSLVQPVRQSVRQLLPLAAERKENKVSHFNDAGKHETQTGSFVYLRLIKINRHMPRPVGSCLVLEGTANDA